MLENEKYISHMKKEHTFLSAMRDTEVKQRLSVINNYGENQTKFKNIMAVVKKSHMTKSA